MPQNRGEYLEHLRSEYLRKRVTVGENTPEVKALYKEYRRELRAVKALRYYYAHLNRVKARTAVRLAILCGDLIRPLACSQCGTLGEVEAHHWSYEPEYWLDVEWLCPKCHRQVHEEESSG